MNNIILKVRCYFSLFSLLILSACTITDNDYSHSQYQGQINDPIMAMAILNDQQYEWRGTPYVLGGQSRKGVDCSGFVQTTFKNRFGINLPRSTKDQANYGKKISLKQVKTGDLVFFKTGRGPHGYHVGIYVKEDQFVHASTKGGVIFSSLNSPYWKKAYWQTRRI